MDVLTPQQQKRLEKLATFFENGDFAILRSLLELEEKYEGTIEEIEERKEMCKQEISEHVSTLRESLRGDKGEAGVDGKDGKNGIDGVDGKDGRDGIDGKDGANGKDGVDGSPDTPEQVREKVESLKGDERVDKSAIKGLEEELKRLEDLANQRVARGFFGGRVAHIPMVDDFSGQTDGSKKVFYLSKEPRSTTTIKVWGTDFPIILRPGTDFTVSVRTLTLTDAVPAPSQGATLIVEYYI